MDGDTHRLTAATVLDTMLAYRRTGLLRTAIELRIFDALADGPRTATDVARALALDERGTHALLGALAAVDLLCSDGTEFALPDDAAELLVSTGSRYLGNTIEVAASHAEWESFGHLTDVVRHGKPVPDHNADAPDFPFWEAFAANATPVTRASARLAAERLLPWAETRSTAAVLDVGCGHGLFGLALLDVLPDARLWLLDWPSVLAAAAPHIERAGVADRVAMIEGDAFDVPLDGPYDVIIVGNLLCQFDANRAEALLARLATALKPGGRLVIVGFTSGDAAPRAEYGGRFVSLLMSLWTADGVAHSTLDYQKMLSRIGFTADIVPPRDDMPHRLVIGSRDALR